MASAGTAIFVCIGYDIMKTKELACYSLTFIVAIYLALCYAQTIPCGNNKKSTANNTSACCITKTNFDSKAHRDYLVTNFTKWVMVYPGNPFGYVPTNTVALQEYALDVLLKQANIVNEKWNLGLPKPITSDHATSFSMLPKTNDIGCSILICNRYGLRISEGKFSCFIDWEYCGNAYEGKPDKYQQRGKQKNHLTKKTALQLARDALHVLGLTEEQLRLPKEPTLFRQGTFIDDDGVEKPFPDYQVRWEARSKQPFWISVVYMEISGITSNVAHFYIVSSFAPKIPLPTNYWEMLGMKEPER